ncbi:hypothetical protein BH24ACT22_BH24ACT22_22070 [soil metagenome]
MVLNEFNNGGSRKSLNTGMVNSKHRILKIVVFFKTSDLNSQV